ncbi:uncharacterized protein LOC142174465 [Nicotiana tabacum]|uniref:Uncharacterized protein LOC142174465 n=1 Tax=Nicotiana tabacum TaxID=4097 RepID=A0AC58TGL7_TOBAC
MHEPQTLSKTYRLARLAEETLAANARAHKGSPLPVKKPTYEPPPHKSSHLIPASMPKLALLAPHTTNIPRTRRTISPAKIQARRAKGLCYFYDEKYTPGHKYNLPKQMFVMDLEFPEEELVEEYLSKSECDSPKEEWSNSEGYSDHSCDWIQCRRPIQILLDGGSTHNYIDKEIANRLGCTVHPTKGTAFNSDLIVFSVSKCDLALGALWMKTLGPVTMGYSDSLWHSTTKIFAEPTSLPPVRDPFDHQIPLQLGDKVVNIRPYRYSTMKKDIIEKLVQEILQQGIIQYNNNPFSPLWSLWAKRCVLEAMCKLQIGAVKQWPTPTNVKQLRGFLGLAGYYRKFIKGYGLISRPLTELLKKDNFHWSEAAEHAFKELKIALTSAPVLALPDYGIPFVVETNTSGTSIGAFLMHNDHPIAFISTGLAPRHIILSIYERELLALVFAVTKWSYYLLGKHFIISTDQKALKYLLEQKLHTDSQIKWLDKLLPFYFEIQYKKGKENMAAYSLYRVPGGELMTLMKFAVHEDLRKEIEGSWNTDPELQALINTL